MIMLPVLNQKDRPDVFNLALAETCVRMVLVRQANDKSRRANKLRKVLAAIDEADDCYDGYLDDDHIDLMSSVLERIQECTDILNSKPGAVLAGGIVDSTREGGEAGCPSTSTGT